MPDNVPTATLMLDRERHWRWDGNAMCALADVDIDLEDLGDERVPPLKKLPALRAILWAGLVGEDPTLTLQDVGRMMHPGNLEAILTALHGARLGPTAPGA